jgi:hypothetical protein
MRLLGEYALPLIMLMLAYFGFKMIAVKQGWSFFAKILINVAAIVLFFCVFLYEYFIGKSVMEITRDVVGGAFCSTFPISICPAGKAKVQNQMKLGPPMAPCIIGKVVHPGTSEFLLEILVVEDGSAVQSIITGSIETNHGSQLREGINSGTVKRFSGSGQLAIGILGVTPEGFPSQVPYLVGANICQGMAPVAISDSGVLQISVPVLGGLYLGQIGIVIPRSILAASQRPHICVEADFPLYRRGMIEGPYIDRKNVRCGFSGNGPGTTSLGDTLRQGSLQMGLILIRRSN